jgi:excisionase family DNA binding protein
MPEPRYHDEIIDVLVTCPKCAHSHTVNIPESELPNSNSERYYRLAEIEKMLGVSRRTVKQWIYDKKLRATKPSEGESKGAPWFVSASDLAEFRRKNRR